MKKLVSLIIALFVISGCSTLEVGVDYDESFDFKQAKTFIIEHHNKESDDTLFNDRVINALTNELKLKNYKSSAKEEADLIFVFHVNVESKSDIQSDYQMMGYRRFGYGGAMVSTTSTYNYKEGTLVIDAMNPKTQKIIWRGTASKELKKQETPKQRREFVNKIVKELMKKFPINKGA